MRPAPCRTGRTESVRLKWLLHHGADGDKQCKGQIELLLPARSLKVLASLSNDSDVYEMGVTGKSLVFWSGTLLFSARLVEGKFPNTSGIFDSSSANTPSIWMPPSLSAPLRSQSPSRKATTGSSLPLVSMRLRKRRKRLRQIFRPGQGPGAQCTQTAILLQLQETARVFAPGKEKITLEFDKFGLLVVRSGSPGMCSLP